MAVIVLVFFLLTRILASSYPSPELPDSFEGYAYKKSDRSFDFYEQGGRKPILVKTYDPNFKSMEIEGKRVRISGLKLIRQETRNKNGFHIEHHLLAKGYAYGLRAKNISLVQADLDGVKLKDKLPRRMISSIRSYISSKGDELNPRAREVYQALILGQLSKEGELLDLSKESSTLHLFVVSGFHFSLIFGLLVSFFKFLLPGHRKLSYLGSLSLALIYYLILGGGFGASRAFISTFFLAHSELKLRKYEPLKALVLVCLLFLIFLPWSVEERGFQLSFLATFFIINVTRFPLIARMESEFLKSLLLSFSVNTLLSFFLVLFSSGYSGLSFVAITYSSFFLSLFLPLLFLYALTPGFLGFINGLLTGMISYLSELLFEFLEILKTYKLSFHIHPSLALALSSFVLLGFLSYLLIYRKRGLIKALAFQLSSLLIVLGPLVIRPELEFISYDLRDGEANLIKYGDTCLLYDVGNDRELLQLLKFDGVHKIDHLIISHADQDHMGIVRDIYREFEVGEAYYDLSKKTRKIGELTLSFDRLEGNYSRNDESLTMRLEYKNTSVYFTGDIQIDGMKHSLKEAVDCEILKIPHHGSYTDLSPLFIEKCKPEYCIIAGGRGKKIDKEPIHKYLNRQARAFYDTMLQGEMRIRFNGKTWDYED